MPISSDPDVKFHHSKLNFKWAEGGEEVKWHQDIQYWPHTNYSPLTIGTYLHDVGPEQGPLGAIPGSHKGELFDEYNDKGQWVGCLSDHDLRKVPLETAEYLMGPAGSVTIHNCRTIHGSRPNLSDLGSDRFCSTSIRPRTRSPTPRIRCRAVTKGRLSGAVLRGTHATTRGPCQVPPDWSGGYTSLFALQQEEEWDETSARRGGGADPVTSGESISPPTS